MRLCSLVLRALANDSWATPAFWRRLARLEASGLQAAHDSCRQAWFVTVINGMGCRAELSLSSTALQPVGADQLTERERTPVQLIVTLTDGSASQLAHLRLDSCIDVSLGRDL